MRRIIAFFSIFLAATLWATDVDALVRLTEELNQLRRNEVEARHQGDEQRAALETELSGLQAQCAEVSRLYRHNQQLLSSKQEQVAAIQADSLAIQRRLRSLQEQLRAAENKLLAQQATWPRPLAEQLQPRLSTLDPDDVSLDNLPERLSALLAIYSKLKQWAASVTTKTEIVVGEDGISREYRILYLGLAAAYGVSTDGKSAFRALPGKDGWTRVFNPDWGRSIAKAVEIAGGDRPAQLVALPMHLPQEATK